MNFSFPDNTKEHKDLVVRVYESSDYKKVDDLWTETGVGSPERCDNNKIILDTINNGGQLLILEKKKSKMIIGTSWMTNDGRRVHLHHFCIKNSEQGRGYANLLMEASMAFVAFLGLQVKVEVEDSNIKALRLYNKFGFKYLGDYHVYIVRQPE
jgi:ribosomal protein S18 acetylase RimI-like enzyme